MPGGVQTNIYLNPELKGKIDVDPSAITPEEAAKSVFRDVGIDTTTHGHIKHRIVHYMFSWMSRPQ